MRIALATCKKLPDWEIDDRPLHAALADRDVEVLQPAWDDAAFDWSSCDACLVRTTWDYVPRRDAFLAWAKRTASQIRFFNPPEIVEWNTHKGYLRDLELRDVPVIPTIWLKAGRENHEWREALAARGWERAFLKPVVGANANDTFRFDVNVSGLTGAEHHLKGLAPGRPMMLQPYLTLVETEGEYSVIMIDGEPAHVVRKYPLAGDYRVQDDHGGKDEPAVLPNDVMNMTRRTVRIAEEWMTPSANTPKGTPLLYARVDLLRDDAGDLKLTELEIVEPSLFFRHGTNTAAKLADALIKRLR